MPNVGSELARDSKARIAASRLPTPITQGHHYPDVRAEFIALRWPRSSGERPEPTSDLDHSRRSRHKSNCQTRKSRRIFRVTESTTTRRTYPDIGPAVLMTLALLGIQLAGGMAIGIVAFIVGGRVHRMRRATIRRQSSESTSSHFRSCPCRMVCGILSDVMANERHPECHSSSPSWWPR